MKLLFINDAAGIGGVEVVLEQMLNHFCGSYELAFLYSKEPNMLNLSPKIKVFKCKYEYALKSPSYKPIRELKRLKAAEQLAKQFQDIDVIVAFKPNAILLANCMKKYMRKVAIFGCLHGHYKSDYRFRHKKAFKGCDALSTLSQINKSFYAKLGIKAEVLANPLSKKPLKVIKERLIIIAQRLTPDKRTDLFIQALNLIANHIRKFNYKVCVIGDGSCKPALESAACQINDFVRFLGAKTHDEVCLLYAKARICVVASEQEGYCISLAEPSFYRCARISTAFEGESLELLAKHNDNALIAQLSARSLAACILRCVRDEELISKLANNANENLAPILCQDAFKAYDEILQRLLS